MVAGDNRRHAVHVEHAHLHGAHGGGGAITGGEGEGVRRVVGRGPFDVAQDRVVDDVLARCPFKVASFGVKAHTSWCGVVVDQRQFERVAIGIHCKRGEADDVAFVDQLQWHRQYLRCLVGVGYRYFKSAYHFCCTIAGLHSEAVVAGLTSHLVGILCGKQIRGPAQYQIGVAVGTLLRVERHAARQAGCCPVENIQIGVAR